MGRPRNEEGSAECADGTRKQNRLRPECSRVTASFGVTPHTAGEGRKRSKPFGRKTRGRHGGRRANGLDGFRGAGGRLLQLSGNERLIGEMQVLQTNRKRMDTGASQRRVSHVACWGIEKWLSRTQKVAMTAGAVASLNGASASSNNEYYCVSGLPRWTFLPTGNSRDSTCSAADWESLFPSQSSHRPEKQGGIPRGNGGG